MAHKQSGSLSSSDSFPQKDLNVIVYSFPGVSCFNLRRFVFSVKISSFAGLSSSVLYSSTENFTSLGGFQVQPRRFSVGLSWATLISLKMSSSALPQLGVEEMLFPTESRRIVEETLVKKGNIENTTILLMNHFDKVTFNNEQVANN